MSCRNARRLDVPKLPSQQHAQEQNDGKTDPHGQGLHHVAGFGLSIAAVAHHEKQSSAQTANDGQKAQGDNPFHVLHYPPSLRMSLGPSNAAPPRAWHTARWWFVTAVAVATMALTARLGMWQTDRALHKENQS